MTRPLRGRVFFYLEIIQKAEAMTKSEKTDYLTLKRSVHREYSSSQRPPTRQKRPFGLPFSLIFSEISRAKALTRLKCSRAPYFLGYGV